MGVANCGLCAWWVEFHPLLGSDRERSPCAWSCDCHVTRAQKVVPVRLWMRRCGPFALSAPQVPSEEKKVCGFYSC